MIFWQRWGYPGSLAEQKTLIINFDHVPEPKQRIVSRCLVGPSGSLLHVLQGQDHSQGLSFGLSLGLPGSAGSPRV